IQAEIHCEYITFVGIRPENGLWRWVSKDSRFRDFHNNYRADFSQDGLGLMAARISTPSEVFWNYEHKQVERTVAGDGSGWTSLVARSKCCLVGTFDASDRRRWAEIWVSVPPDFRVLRDFNTSSGQLARMLKFEKYKGVGVLGVTSIAFARDGGSVAIGLRVV